MLRRQVYACVMICTLLVSQAFNHPANIYAAVEPKTIAQVASDTYVNPSYDEINQLMEKIAKEKQIPSVILKAIAFKESSWRQFDKNGQPLLSRPDHPAIGIMQIATYNDNDVETINKLKTDIEFNIRMGADLLNEKFAFTPTIGDGDRNKLENWYFALWAYNIWSDRNNPNSLAATNPGTLSYQEKVLRIIAYPEGFLARYIDPVQITPIPAELLPASGIPAKGSVWATPEPVHYGDLEEEEALPEPSQDPVQQDPIHEDPVQEDPAQQDPAQQEPIQQDPVQEKPEKEPKTLEFTRLAGSNRIETAIEQALEGWPNGAGTVVLARADRFPDALAGVPLAALYGAPILLTGSKSLDPKVEEALQTLKPSKVVLLGGEGALSQEIAARLAALGWSEDRQIRVSGANRYATAANIALTMAGKPILDKEASSTGTTSSLEAVAIATGSNFPDALSIASIAGNKKMPILLTEPNKLPQETLTVLKTLKPQQIYLIGGEGVISSTVQAQIQEELGLTSDRLQRLAGDSRYDTMAAVLETFAGESKALCFATGQEFPDALAGAALAARLQATVILLPQGSVEKYPRLKEAISQCSMAAVTKAYIFGGEGVVSEERIQELKSLF